MQILYLRAICNNNASSGDEKNILLNVLEHQILFEIIYKNAIMSHLTSMMKTDKIEIILK